MIARDTDLTNPHEIESLRRSVAMLPPKANAFSREDAMKVLQVLAEQVRPQTA